MRNFVFTKILPKKIILTGLTGIRSWVVFRLVIRIKITKNCNWDVIGLQLLNCQRLPTEFRPTLRKILFFDANQQKYLWVTLLAIFRVGF